MMPLTSPPGQADSRKRPLIFRCGHCGLPGRMNTDRKPGRLTSPATFCHNPHCRAAQPGFGRRTDYRPPRIRIGRADAANPALAIFMPGELCRRDAVLTTLLKQYRSLAADDPDYVLEAADLNRAINPRWREGDPTPMPVRRAHTWGLR